MRFFVEYFALMFHDELRRFPESLLCTLRALFDSLMEPLLEYVLRLQLMRVKEKSSVMKSFSVGRQIGFTVPHFFLDL